MWILATMFTLWVLARFLKSVQLGQILGWIYLFWGDTVIILLVGMCWSHATHSTKAHTHSYASTHELSAVIISALTVSSTRMLSLHASETRIENLLASLWWEQMIIVVHIISLILLMCHVGDIGSSAFNLVFHKLMILVSYFTTGAFVWVDARRATTVSEATESNPTLLLGYLVLEILELLELTVLGAVGCHWAWVLA